MKIIFSLGLTFFLGLLSWLYQNKPLEVSIRDGSHIYQDFCLQCHMAQGEGVPGTFPPLAQSDYLKNELKKSILGVKYGMKGPIKVNGVDYDGVMVAQGLEDEEIADVMNYILNSWGNSATRQITTEEVRTLHRP